MPREPFVNIRGAANVVALGVGIASQDVDESGSETLHARGQWHAARQRGLAGNAEESCWTERGYAETPVQRVGRLAETEVRLRSAAPSFVETAFA